MKKSERLAKQALKKIALLNLSDAEYEALGLPLPKKKPDQSWLDRAARLLKAFNKERKATKEKPKTKTIQWFTS